MQIYLKHICLYPLSKMTKKSEELDKLWNLHHIAYLQGNGDSYKNQLIECSVPYIKIIADEIHSKSYPTIELDDLKSEGMLGAIEAIKSFNPNKARFITYLDRKIRSKILDYIRNEDLVSRVVRARFYQLEKAKHKLKEELGYEPTRKKLIKELSKDIYPTNPIRTKNYNKKTKFKGRKKAQRIIDDTKNLKKRVYFFPLNNMGEEDREALDVGDKRCLKDKKAPNPLYEAQKRDLKELLIKGTTRAEKLVIALYYYENMSQKKIGGVIGLSESMISLIHTALLSKLKGKLTVRGLNLEDCLNNL